MDTLEAIRIDLADYEYAGEGANGVSYNHRHDPDVMLKLYRPGMVTQPLEEMRIARKVFQAGIRMMLDTLNGPSESNDMMAEYILAQADDFSFMHTKD